MLVIPCGHIFAQNGYQIRSSSISFETSKANRLLEIRVRRMQGLELTVKLLPSSGEISPYFTSTPVAGNLCANTTKSGKIYVTLDFNMITGLELFIPGTHYSIEVID